MTRPSSNGSSSRDALIGAVSAVGSQSDVAGIAFLFGLAALAAAALLTA